MATQKRRVIYMDDVEWSVAKDRAQVARMSISLYIRTVVGAFPGISAAGQELAREVYKNHPQPTDRPFAEFRPVPKPGRK